ncbi:ATP-dependent Clp protease adaptor ClpS [Desulfotalea psychrophila]|uniref:ATP-dependent Clp protease adapter protein ClpS n=1 Tax=Desulfotalea psychrophila (strain LSv54 / DSM 12343) TaxID=177439 RepID=CLPS_DESPS|nr:ATP-dependent Clp protease adaptor ClpS [Desulfotalea psychrophila]Q6APV7.1 RecName: Full=ATP-dependent Clp protease adapter protein ClpS [Desulfotalea psychrophila LSv54]CAG35616.1 conserved hypothetical protein [Desulfotalea psychrophila LSv54]
MTEDKQQSDSATIDDIETREPPMYRVLIHNDDYTSMDFVVAILMQIFSKTEAVAEEIMLTVHSSEVGVAGLYTHEIAETKVAIVHQLAEQNEFPLRCSLEKE